MNEVIVLPKGIDQLSPKQKVVAGTMTLGVVGGVSYLLLPFAIIALTNLIYFLVLVSIIVIVAYNYDLLWNIFKTISWKLTQAWIGLDSLAAAERYYEWTGSQLQEATKALTDMMTNLNGLVTKISQREKAYAEHSEKAKAALSLPNGKVQAEVYGEKAIADKQYLQDLIPMREGAEERTKQMSQIVDIFTVKREKLRYKIDTQADKRQTLLAEYKGMAAFNKFLSSDDINAKMYLEAEKQIANDIHQFTASIEIFQNKIRPVLQEAEVDKELAKSEVAKFLETLKD